MLQCNVDHNLLNIIQSEKMMKLRYNYLIDTIKQNVKNILNYAIFLSATSHHMDYYSRLQPNKFINQSIKFISQKNVNKINNEISSIDDADISNLHIRIYLTMRYTLQGSQCHRLTGKR